MRSMQWQLGILGTISAFAYRHREAKKNLCRDGRSQDLPRSSDRDLKQMQNMKGAEGQIGKLGRETSQDVNTVNNN